MARTLKERYELKVLQEKVQRVDRQLVEETRVARLLVEEMSQDDLDTVSAIVDKLERIKDAASQDSNLEVLTNAIDQALQDLNKYTGGGPITAAWTKLKSKVGVENPVVKIATFANALERGFKQLPQILRNNGIDLKKLADGQGNVTLKDAIARQLDGKNKEKSLTGEAKLTEREAVPPGAGANRTPATSLAQQAKDIDAMGKSDKSPEAAKKLKIVIDQIRKALAPAGVFGAFKKIPYVDGAALAQALPLAHIGVLNSIATAIKGGPQTDQIAADLKANVSGGSENGAQNGAGAEKPTNGSTPSSPADADGKPPAGTTPADQPAAGVGDKNQPGPGERNGGGAAKPAAKTKVDDGEVQQLADYIAKATKADPGTVLKILTVLNKNGKLREGLKR